MKNVIFVLLSIITFTSCNDEPQSLGQMPLDSTAPGVISNVQVENGPGLAIITYDLPDDEDLLYVKATYNVNERVTRSAEASYFNNSLLLEGFGESKPYTARVVAVDASKNESEPVEVIVYPETPPVVSSFESLEVIPTFGGLNLQWANEAEKDLNIEVYVNDTNNVGNFVEATIIYSSDSEGNVSIRGYEPEPRTFLVIITDRWGNKSDTLEKVALIPLEEIEFDPTDWVVEGNIWNHVAGPVEQLTDGILTGNWNRALWKNENPEEVERATLTIDLGRTVKLSRMKEWQWSSRLYDHSNTRYFKIWGSNDPPEDLNDFSNWSLIIEDGEMIKPSGLPRGQTTAEDRQRAMEGHTTDFPISTPVYRYLRYENVLSWDGTKNFIQITELKLFGAYAD